MSFARFVDFLSNAPRLLRYLERETKEEARNIENTFVSLTSMPATFFRTKNNIGRIFNQKTCDAALIAYLNRNKRSVYNKGNEITVNQLDQLWESYQTYKKEKNEEVKKDDTKESTLLFKELRDCENSRIRGQRILEIIYDEEHQGSDHWRCIAIYVDNLPLANRIQEEKSPAPVYPSLGG